jgi:hypothetical protein
MVEHRSAAPRVVPPSLGPLTTAVGERNTGIRKIGRVTWQAGAVGLVFSGLLAGVLHNTSVSETRRSGPASTQSGSTGTQSGQGGVLIPAQPPAPASGSGQVTSGAS